ncbi:MAG: 2-dehydropantoate 2-reductase [Pseudomonadota bacterium]
MRIAVFGAGAVGGYFGGRLAAAGEDVTFVARGDHLRAIRETGLRIESPNGDLTIHPAQATDDPASIGPVDYVLFAVKLFDTEAVARACKPMMGPNTTVLALQNGVETEEIIGDVLGADTVMGGTVYIAAVIAEPGLIRQTGAFARMIFGEMDGSLSERGKIFEAACHRAGIDAALSPTVASEIWMKFIVLAALSGVTTVTRKAVGGLRADPDTRALLQNAIAEAAAVGRAHGVALAEDAVERQMAVLDGWPPDMVASMLHDLRAGKRMELDHLSGAVSRIGRRCGVPTPVHDTLYAALKPHKDG